MDNCESVINEFHDDCSVFLHLVPSADCLSAAVISAHCLLIVVLILIYRTRSQKLIPNGSVLFPEMKLHDVAWCSLLVCFVQVNYKHVEYCAKVLCSDSFFIFYFQWARLCCNLLKCSRAIALFDVFLLTFGCFFPLISTLAFVPNHY